MYFFTDTIKKVWFVNFSSLEVMHRFVIGQKQIPVLNDVQYNWRGCQLIKKINIFNQFYSLILAIIIDILQGPGM